MKTHAHDNAHATQRRAVAHQAEHGDAAAQLAQAGPAAVDHHVNHSPRMVAQRQLLGAAFGPVAQREPQGLEEELPVQGKALALQAKQVGSDSIGTVQAQTEVPAEANLTGMPNQLKSGVEALSGMDMSDVRVHRNSDKPAQLNALAYAQGNDIHLGRGQEQHLPHEAWHVVQQRQGRVQATVQMAGVGVNDDVGLEEEADVMGAAAQLARVGKGHDLTPYPQQMPGRVKATTGRASSGSEPPVVQGAFEWLWQPVVGAVAGIAGRIGNALDFGGGNNTPPVAPVAPALPTPADIRQRLIAAEKMLTTAANTLPDAIRAPWAAQEPAMVANRVQPAFGNVNHLVAFPPGAAAVADENTALIEHESVTYRDYCASARPVLERARVHRDAYLAQLSAGDIGHFDKICIEVEQGNVTVAQTKDACAQFIKRTRVSSVMTSDALYTLMSSGGAGKEAAEWLVHQYFEHGRLKIGNWRIGYASQYDAKTQAFGAEWTLKAGDTDLSDVAGAWVFHTHASCDEARNFTISRQMGASHIKRIVDATAVGVSLNFVNDKEFERVEKDADTQKSFQAWVFRDGAKALRNTNKRK